MAQDKNDGKASPRGFVRDVVSAMTVSILSLPMAMAFGVASGLGAAAGLYAAIFGGMVAAMAGGNKFQVTGPTPPTAVALAAIVASSQTAGIPYATIFLAGAILLFFGLFGMGNLIRYTPYPLIMGFLTGISLLILREIAVEALSMPAYEALLIPATTILAFILEGIDKRIPSLLTALVVISTMSYAFGIHAETIGDISLSLPFPSIRFAVGDLAKALPPAFSLALIISMDSLLTTVIVDKIKATESDANRELVGQGLGNIASSLMGGIAVSGSDVPTLANIKAGANSRLSSILSRVFLAALVLFLAPLLPYVVKAALSGLLLYIAIEIVDYSYISRLWRIPREDAAVFVTVAILTATVSLVVAVGIGIVLASFLFLKKIAEEPVERVLVSDHFSGSEKERARKYEDSIAIYQINAPLFFGSAEMLKKSLRHVKGRKAVVLKMYPVTSMDESGAMALKSVISELKKRRMATILTGVRKDIMEILEDYGIVEIVGKDNIIFNPRRAVERAVEHVSKNGDMNGI